MYTDEAIVTQIDDGATPDTGTGRRITSSISKPSIVATMLGHLEVEYGMRVLEIGAGTGWNAALLAHMVGEGNVTTIEVDGDLAERARETLAGVGVSAAVVTGDGADGYARLRVPDVTTKFQDADDGSDDFTFWAFSGPSWARVDVADGAVTHRVRQRGPRSLWTEIEAAYRWWDETGRPETGRFGIAVTPDRQYVYLDSPGNPVA